MLFPSYYVSVKYVYYSRVKVNAKSSQEKKREVSNSDNAQYERCLRGANIRRKIYGDHNGTLSSWKFYGAEKRSRSTFRATKRDAIISINSPKLRGTCSSFSLSRRGSTDDEMSCSRLPEEKRLNFSPSRHATMKEELSLQPSRLMRW